MCTDSEHFTANSQPLPDRSSNWQRSARIASISLPNPRRGPADVGPGGAGARHVAENLPDARLVVFEGSGHGHYIEQQDESLAVILQFLAAS